MTPKHENEPIEDKKTDDTAVCFYCGEEKPSYYSKSFGISRWKKTINCCKDCAHKAKTQGVVQTFEESFFGSIKQEHADKTTEKVKAMSEKKRKKLTKKLTKLGYSEEQIAEAIKKIEKGVKI